ncbi:MAG: S46 family peptidase [Bacteroidetes bacterium]|nr:S46 family peptidase [Bacteroidota bacterium]
MKKTLICYFIFFTGLLNSLRADEGMWLMLFIDRLNYTDMQKMGLNLTPEEIYSVNNSSLKDAIIQFGGGCTGEVISPSGLIITNHHCGYGSIQSQSSVEHDYLTEGFWAGSKEEELPIDGLTARFLIRIEDVSQRVLNEVNDQMTEKERGKKIEEINKVIIREATEGTPYDASVRSFYKGNEYYLFVYTVYKDVRLVGAPPTSIGNYGGDTDNWMWPRHTADFSLFRIYSAPDGKPAEYSKDNIPLKPKYYLPISLDGVEKDDFAMILGYPGGTNRYLTSYGVTLAVEQNNPTIVKIRQEKLDIYKADMDASDQVRIQYASKYARVSNYWKYYIGQTKGLKRLKIADRKREQEDQFKTWALATPERKAKYGTILTQLEQAFKEQKEFDFFRIYYTEAVRGCEAMTFSSGFTSLKNALMEKNPDQEKVTELIKPLQGQAERFFKDYNLPTDKRIMASMLTMYDSDVPENFKPEEFIRLAAKYKGEFKKFAAQAFEKSIFVNREKINALLSKHSAKAISNDPVYALMFAFSNFFTKTMSNMDVITDTRSKCERLYMAGLREMQPDKKFYPDANSTMRMTYGQVLDYYPADAVHYDYQTTLFGVMQKEDPSNSEFIVPEKLKKLYEARDYGRYGQNGNMYVCFLTNNDITGGNSGSPVLNGDGQLIGLAFDGNWEAMSGDIAFEPDYQRTICVDIRYVLFIIDKYAGAKNIVDELTLVEKK